MIKFKITPGLIACILNRRLNWHCNYELQIIMAKELHIAWCLKVSNLIEE